MSKFKNQSWALLALSIIAFAACKKKEDTKVETENFKGVYVINEGGFGKSNASVGLYKPGSGDYFDAFKKANGRPLGDVIQSMTLIGNKYYIIVNNSNKIEVVNQADFKSVTTITVSQPRFIIAVSSTKAYISQMGSSMSVLDLNSNSITKTITVHGPTENMTVMHDTLYVGKACGDKIYRISIASDALVDSLTVGGGVSSIVSVSADRIAFLCTGFPSVENGKIAFINRDSFKLERFIPMTAGSYSGIMVYSGSLLYYNMGDAKVNSLSPSALALPTSALISITGSVYGFSVEPSSGNIYVTDAGDFTNPGKVLIYNSAGTFQKQFTAGIAPSKIIFNN